MKYNSEKYIYKVYYDLVNGSIQPILDNEFQR